MPRPTMDMDGPEYQEILRGREMHRLYGRNFRDMLWAEETLDRLEKRLPLEDYTDRDRADFHKAKEIHARVFAKPPQDSHITPRYIWRTQGDGKVRESHARNNGKIFSWGDAPSTGHPGEDFNCRCWAEPLVEQLEERERQVVIFSAPDKIFPWTDVGLGFHYYFGGGKPVTLPKIGHLKDVIDCAMSHIQTGKGGGSVFQRVERKVFAEARRSEQENFVSVFEASYDFRPAVWSFGDSTAKGKAHAHVTKKEDFLIITANVEYNFYDRYTDPFDINNRTPGEVDTIGKPYNITGEWRTRIEAIIRKDGKKSRFPDGEFGDLFSR